MLAAGTRLLLAGPAWLAACRLVCVMFLCCSSKIFLSIVSDDLSDDSKSHSSQRDVDDHKRSPGRGKQYKDDDLRQARILQTRAPHRNIRKRASLDWTWLLQNRSATHRTGALFHTGWVTQLEVDEGGKFGLVEGRCCGIIDFG